MCSIYREKKSGKGSNGHMTVGKGEIENIIVGKEGGGTGEGKGERWAWACGLSHEP